jgi:hypothetical protein
MLQVAKEKAKSFLINIAQPYMAGNLSEEVFQKQLNALPIEVREQYNLMANSMPIELVKKTGTGQLTLNEIEAL